MPDTKQKQDDPAQSQRFIDMAREVGADESPNAMERAMDMTVKRMNDHSLRRLQIEVKKSTT